MTHEKDESRPAQTQGHDRQHAVTETPVPEPEKPSEPQNIIFTGKVEMPMPKPEKPVEPQNIIFRGDTEPENEPLIQFEKKTFVKKDAE